MSSNAALSAARRRRSNPSGAVPPTTNMQSHIPPVNRILQRTGVPPSNKPQPLQPQFNQRMPPPQQKHMRGPPPQTRYQPQQQPQQMARPQSPGLPPLPPPVKTAGPLYGIPIHPLVMFKTHDNKLNEHDLSIGDCIEQLKEIDGRLTAFESSNGSNGSSATGEVVGGDLNDLMNDDAFINGVVDNIMNTTNFASIVENIIPLKEENEAFKQQVHGLNEQVHGLNEQVHGLNEQVHGLHEQMQEWKDKMQQLEDQVRSIFSSASSASGTVVVSDVQAGSYDEKCRDGDGDRCEEGEEGEAGEAGEEGEEGEEES